MSDYLQPADLEKDKKHSTFFSEVITGKTGGLAGGANIDTATNAVTSQTQKTMPKIMGDAESEFDSQLSGQQAEFDAQLQAQGWNPVDGSFESGSTIVNRRDILYWAAAKAWHSWQGTLPKVVTAGSTPATTGGVSSTAWVDRTDGALRDELAAIDGADMIGDATYAQIRAYSGAATKIECKGISSTSRHGAGLFILDTTDTVTPDDGGCILIDANGGRWKRDLSGVYRVLAEWYGCEDGQAIDDQLDAASEFAIANGIPVVYLPATPKDGIGYTIAREHVFYINTQDFTVKSAGYGKFTTKINHTASSGYGISIRRTSAGGINIFAVGGVEKINIYGNPSAYGFAQLADSFGMYAKDLMAWNYTRADAIAIGAAVTLSNLTYWTENARISNVHTRNCSCLLNFTRTSAGGGTGSFFGLVVENCWHQFTTSGLAAILIQGSSPANHVTVYGAKIDIGGWFESGTNNSLILVSDNGSLIESDVIMRADGFGGRTDGGAAWGLRQLGNGHIDVKCNNLSMQGVYVNLDTYASGSSVYSFQHCAYCTPWYSAVAGSPQRPSIRASGAEMKFVSVGSTANRVLTIRNLPIHSNFKCSLNVVGANKVFAGEFLISTAGVNDISAVKLVSAANQDTNFFVRNFSGLASLAYSANNGGSFDIVLNNADAISDGASNINIEIKLEML